MIENCDGFINDEKKGSFIIFAAVALRLISQRFFSLSHLWVPRCSLFLELLSSGRSSWLCYFFLERNLSKNPQANYLLSDLIIGFDKVRDRSI